MASPGRAANRWAAGGQIVVSVLGDPAQPLEIGMIDACPPPHALHIALIGNPNTGKSTLFSALVGVHQRVGNYPGVTVEKHTGDFECGGRRCTLIDLPGLYSLSPRSRDELVAVEVLLGSMPDMPRVDAIILIVDASNLERNLYLVSQVLEIGLPTIVALNMIDVAEAQGVRIDVTGLARRLDVPVVAMQAHRGIGLEALKEALTRLDPRPGAARRDCLPAAFGAEASGLAAELERAGLGIVQRGNGGRVSGVGRGLGARYRHRHGHSAAVRPLPEWFVRRLLLDVSGMSQRVIVRRPDPWLHDLMEAARQRLAQLGSPVPTIETEARYDWARRIVEAVVAQPTQSVPTLSDRIDRFLTDPVAGTAILALLVAAVFQGVYGLAEPVTRGIEAAAETLGHGLEVHLPAGALRSLLIDGVLGGVGTVLAFLPQILVLFLFLGILEDCGYLARAAFLMDGLMARVGLSGKSFIPLLSSFGCAVPGIMATRVIESDRDRLVTILVAPLMTCSARLPVFALLIAAFIPPERLCGGLLNLQGLTLLGLYALGIAAAVVAAMVLKRTMFRGETPPFLMDLPTYKWPSPRTVLLRVLERGYSFIQYAGTMILAVSIVVWAALYWPHDAERVEGPFRELQTRLHDELERLAPDDPARAATAARLASLERQITAAYQEQSYLGRFGRWIEPIVRPLGWDWRIGTAVIASFPAREIVVATLGVIFHGADQAQDAEDQPPAELGQRLHDATWPDTGQPLFTVPVALSLMVFYALCAQCAATLAVIRQETHSWRWPAFTFTYMTGLAYSGAWLTYQIGTWLE